jgi:hypothetical protein
VVLRKIGEVWLAALPGFDSGPRCGFGAVFIVLVIDLVPQFGAAAFVAGQMTASVAISTGSACPNAAPI